VICDKLNNIERIVWLLG